MVLSISKLVFGLEIETEDSICSGKARFFSGRYLSCEVDKLEDKVEVSAEDDAEAKGIIIKCHNLGIYAGDAFGGRLFRSIADSKGAVKSVVEPKDGPINLSTNRTVIFFDYDKIDFDKLYRTLH